MEEGRHCEWAHWSCKAMCKPQALLGAQRAHWPELLLMNVQPGAGGGGAWVLPSGGELLRIPMMPPLQRRPFPLLSQALSATPTPPPGLEAERLAQTAGRRARCLESLPWIPVVAPRIAC